MFDLITTIGFGGAALFGAMVATGLWVPVFKSQDRALADADAEIDRVNTLLAAEKFENEHLAAEIAFVRRERDEALARLQPRDPATGRMLRKVAA